MFRGKRSASASTSDLTADGIRQLVDGAIALSQVTEEDPFTGLPEATEFGSLSGDLHLYYDDVYSLEGPERIEWARRAEAAALGADPRITNSDGGSFDAATGRMVLANSRGFHDRTNLNRRSSHLQSRHQRSGSWFSPAAPCGSRSRSEGRLS